MFAWDDSVSVIYNRKTMIKGEVGSVVLQVFLLYSFTQIPNISNSYLQQLNMKVQLTK